MKRVDDNDASIEVDFNEAISSQVEALQGGGRDERRFQAVDTKTSNCIFIKTTLDHPEELVTKLLSDVTDTGRTKARFILKIFPVLGTCRAVEDKIEKLVEELVSSYFADRPLGTFAIIYKVRCNNLSRDVILPAVGKAVYKVCPLSRVDLTNPDYVISVDVLTKFACISIMKDFNKLKKYNLQELAKSGAAGSCRTSDQPTVQQNEPVSDEPVNDEISSNQEDNNCQQSQLATNTRACGGVLAVEKVAETHDVDDLLLTTQTSGDHAADCSADPDPDTDDTKGLTSNEPNGACKHVGYS